VLDGEEERRGMAITGTGFSGYLTLRAVTFKECSATGSSNGGALFLEKGESRWSDGYHLESFVNMYIQLCIFTSCRSTGQGGAIYFSDTDGTVIIYGTSFLDNSANSEDGNDIRNHKMNGGGTITIHNTCPSPYSSNTPIQGKMRIRIV
jgi:hypothetical protein